MVIFSNVLTILIQIGAPVLLAVILLRRFKPGWIILLTGVLTFIGSQMVHLPLLSFINLLPSNLKFLLDASIYPLNYAILLGLLAGLCEESARWVGFKLLKQRGTSWKAALTLGAGHGGMESLLVGVMTLINLVIMLVVRGGGSGGLDTLSLAQAKAQLDPFFNTPFHLPLAGAAERLFAIILQITLTVMVWLALNPREGSRAPRLGWLWFAGAVLLHAFTDALAVRLVLAGWGTWQIEGILALLALLCLVFLFTINRRVKSWDALSK